MQRRTLGSSLREVGPSAQDSFGESHAAVGARWLHTDRTNLPAGGGRGRKDVALHRRDLMSMSGMLNVLAIARSPCAPGKDPAMHTATPLTRRSPATG